MKIPFVSTITKIAQQNLNSILLTGDLGFNAFEDIQKKLGPRFINAGVAEQNMVNLAAGLAYSGYSPWAYSIASFLVFKTFEQIRNNLSIRNLKVNLIGNGGGFGYGIMGSTHHTLEDIALFGTLPNFKTFIPAFNEDVEPIMQKIEQLNHSSYLRLGYDATVRSELFAYEPVRNILPSKAPKTVCIALGTLAQQLLPIADTPDMSGWVVCEAPCKLPENLLGEIRTCTHLVVAEEASERGGLGDMVFRTLALCGIHAPKTTHLYAKHNEDHTYGSQMYHLKKNGLDSESLAKVITEQ